MLAYPLAILYFLQYLGFQEVSLPMHREHPAAYLRIHRPRVSTPLSRWACWSPAWWSAMLVENSRFGLALLAIRQNELAAEAAGHQRTAMEDARAGHVGRDRRGCRRAVCLRAAGGHAGFGLRPAGLRAGSGGHVVRRRGVDLGTGDRCRDAGALGGITERASWATSFPASRAWCTARRSS